MKQTDYPPKVWLPRTRLSIFPPDDDDCVPMAARNYDRSAPCIKDVEYTRSDLVPKWHTPGDGTLLDEGAMCVILVDEMDNDGEIVHEQYKFGRLIMSYEDETGETYPDSFDCIDVVYDFDGVTAWMEIQPYKNK